MLGLHPDLRRHNALVFVSSAAVAILGALMIGAAVLDLAAFRAAPAWILVVFGAAFLVIGYLGAVRFPRWYRQASRIVAAGRPTPATVVLRREYDQESISLTARVRSSAAKVGGEVPLLSPRWDVSPLLGRPQKVDIYRESRRGRVVALSTPRGMLWSLPHR